MTRAPLIELNDGHKIPQLGLGTWPLNDAQVADAVVEAVSHGYRHIDTAVKYGNEKGVGNGIRTSGVDRGELFITTKLDGEYQGSGRAVAGLEGSLERLGLDYVDLLLIHWPLPGATSSSQPGEPLRNFKRRGKRAPSEFPTSSRRTSTACSGKRTWFRP